MVRGLDTASLIQLSSIGTWTTIAGNSNSPVFGTGTAGSNHFSVNIQAMVIAGTGVSCFARLQEADSIGGPWTQVGNTGWDEVTNVQGIYQRKLFQADYLKAFLRVNYIVSGAAPLLAIDAGIESVQHNLPPVY